MPARHLASQWVLPFGAGLYSRGAAQPRWTAYHGKQRCPLSRTTCLLPAPDSSARPRLIRTSGTFRWAGSRYGFHESFTCLPHEAHAQGRAWSD